MRFKVELRYGYASFDVADEEKAWQLFADEGLRIRLCEDIHDDGIVLAGAPLGVDLDPRRRREVA